MCTPNFEQFYTTAAPQTRGVGLCWEPAGGQSEENHKLCGWNTLDDHPPYARHEPAEGANPACSKWRLCFCSDKTSRDESRLKPGDQGTDKSLRASALLSTPTFTLRWNVCFWSCRTILVSKYCRWKNPRPLRFRGYLGEIVSDSQILWTCIYWSSLYVLCHGQCFHFSGPNLQ